MWRRGKTPPPHDRSKVGDVVEEAYSRFPVLGDRRHQIAGTLSGGEQQMLSLSRALTTDPSVLLLDEISMGLAPMIVDSLFEVVSKLREEGLSILIVEQRVENAMKLADYVALMYKGSIGVVGEPADLEDRLGAAYFGAESSEGSVPAPLPQVNGSKYVRTARGSLRHFPGCVIVRTSVDHVVATSESDLPMCGMCGRVDDEVPQPAGGVRAR